ncbi:MAG: glutathione S-transferase family protein [Myxococcales bacterium]|nr:glutathione S-transferase family protein [Myxococcales bacterium]
MSQIKLFGFAPSTYVRTARMTCAEVGETHDLQPLEFKQPSHLALHPFGKMPVLEHEGLVLFETLAITSYLDDTFGNGQLQPKDAKQRAKMLQWVSACIDYIYPDVVTPFHETASGELREKARAHLSAMDKALDQSAFLAGDTLSLADLFAYPMVEYCAAKAGAEVGQGMDNLARWRAAIAKRESARETSA